MELISSIASKEVIIPVTIQILLFVALFVQQTKIGEKIKLEYAKQSISYQISQTEYIKQRFEHVNELFAQLIDQQNFIQHRVSYFTGNYRKFEFQDERLDSKRIRSSIQNHLLKTSFYINVEARDLINEYLSVCEKIVVNAINWGVTQKQIDLTEQDIDDLSDSQNDALQSAKGTQIEYILILDKNKTLEKELFRRIEISLRNQLEVS